MPEILFMSSDITIYLEIFARRKLLPISLPALLAKLLSVNFLSCVNDYIEDMVTFTALAKLNISVMQR